MSKKYDDDFFEDLDKTTDLLKAFKPHIEEESSLNNFDDIYNDLKKSNKNNRNDKKNNSIINSKINDNKLENKISVIDNKKTIIEKDNRTDSDRYDLNAIFEKKYNSMKKEEKEYRKIEKQEQNKSSISDIVRSINKKAKESKHDIDKSKESTIEKDNVDTNKRNIKEKKKTKFSKFEIIFCSFSFLFIVGCLCVYSSRFLKYYKIYNPKSDSGKNLMLLTTAIGKNSTLVYEGDGLYMSGGDYIYKGDNVKNYLRFSNLTWRIIKSNNDGTVDLVLDDYINTLYWDPQYKKYIESDVSKYLNEYFINYLDLDYLDKTTICMDEVNDIKKFSCNDKNNDYYVRLLSVNDFLNSKTSSTYMSNEKSSLWLNTISSDKVWQINGQSLSLSKPNRLLGIKPVIKLKNDVALISGDGSKENPYIIKEDDDNIHLGEYIKLGNETYVVYNIDGEYLDLALSGFCPKTYRYSINDNKYNLNDENSLAYLLNNSIINSLPYKDLIVEKKWNDGIYDGTYESINSSNVVAKIGLLSIDDLKFDSELNDYFLLNTNGSKTFIYDNETIVSNPGINKNIRIAIRIKNKKVASGKGSKLEPYVLEG